MCKFCVRQDFGGEFTRREVLVTMAGAGMAAGLMGSGVLAAPAEAGGTPSPADPLDLRVVYLRPAGKYWLGWPGTFWDVDGFAAKSRRLVEQFARELGMKPVFEPAPLHEKADIEAFVKKVQAESPRGCWSSRCTPTSSSPARPTGNRKAASRRLSLPGWACGTTALPAGSCRRRGRRACTCLRRAIMSWGPFASA